MELMDIIKSSVTLFSGLILGVVFISYIVFKVRDKSRAKPYENLKPIENYKKPVIKKQEITQRAVNVTFNKVVTPQYQATIRPVNAPVHYVKETVHSPLQPTKPRISIYNQYSFNSDEQMHKLRLSNYYSPNL